MAPAWYFAYGSNMQTATFCGRRDIRFQHALPGRASGWRLVFDKPPLFPIGESFANIIPEADAEVLGVLYEISEADLEQIDLTEGVPVGNYRRIEIPVLPLSTPSAVRSAFTLVSDRRVPDLQPSTRYMSLLIEGAVEHGLPPEYVAFLRAVPACTESRRAALLRPLIDQFLRRR